MAKDGAYWEALEKIEQEQQENTTWLDLSGIRLTELPLEIAQLTNLQYLSLNNNELTALLEVITQLTNLRYLNLSKNQLTALPEVIAQLTNLQTLNLSDNQLTVLPEAITHLTNLQRLSLDNNQLRALPETITQLTNLKDLNLQNNQLTALPETITQPTNLQRLSLDNNQLTTLPETIAQLTNLQRLSLDNNQLTTLPETIAQLTNIKDLNLQNNQLTALPKNIGNLKELKRLSLGGNPLPIPKEIIREGWTQYGWKYGGPRVIIEFYLELLAKEKKPLNEAKVILVGQGTVGKTSLVKRLCTDDFDPSECKTDGIAISNLPLNLTLRAKEPHNVRLNIWDFGGQEIMHATHQFFLTERSLYLLVLNNRNTEEENRLEYWLNTIESFGADSPIIMVGNKADDHPLDLNEKDLKEKYPNIKAFISISCKKNKKIPTLRNLIRREIKALPHVSDAIPKHWFKVKEQLEKLKKNYIPYDEYERICIDKGIPTTEKQKILVGLLHDLGIVLNFQNDPNVNDTNVINPEWLTSGIYRIINYPELTTKFKGILSYPLLEKILPQKDYPTHKHKFIIAMMKKFELCLELGDDTVLIPNLLPKSAPESLDESQWQNSLKFEYHYPILSQSVISRFIVKMHHRIQNKTWWRTGVVLNNGQNSALIKADLYDKKIFIAVNGTPQTRRDFLAEIRGCFASINKTFSDKSQPEQKIPLPNNPKITVGYKHLLTLERKGIKEQIFEGTEEPVDIAELLSGIKPISSDQETFDKIRGDIHFHGETTVQMSDIKQSGNFGIGHMSGGTLKDNAKAIGQYNEAPSQNLAQAAKDIKVLIEQLQGNYNTQDPFANIDMGREIVSQINQNPTLKSRVINALKESTAKAFEEAISHPVGAIIAAGFKGFIDAA